MKREEKERGEKKVARVTCWEKIKSVKMVAVSVVVVGSSWLWLERGALSVS